MVRLPYQIEATGPSRLGLGPADPGLERLQHVVGSILGDPRARVASAAVRPVDYEHATITTAGLHRVIGTAESAGRLVSWSVFVKVLQHVRHWPVLATLPPEAAEEMVRVYPWKADLETREQVLPVVPEGLRVPDVYLVHDLGEDRLAIWMEDIDVDETTWSLDVYAKCAFLLGRLAARRTPDRPAGAGGLPVGFAVRGLVRARSPLLAGLLADDALWSRPLVADVVDEDYRRDLTRVHTMLPECLDAMDKLPQALPHGDATPANLLRPRAEPGVFVAIDWNFGCPLPVGHDLAQLLVGGSAGRYTDPAMLADLQATILPAYTAGLAKEGMTVPEDTVRAGYVAALATRVAPEVFPLEDTDAEPTDAIRWSLAQRAAVGRFVLDQVLAAG